MVLSIPRSIRDGTYTLVACADVTHRVRESDEANNCRTAATPVVIDTVAPAPVRFVVHPRAESADTSPRFEFAGEEPELRFTCRLDGAPFADCGSTVALDAVAEGTHRFEVVARDAAANTSAPASFEWVVDVTPPAAPVIDARPDPVAEGGEAWFAFGQAEHDASYACALDDAPLTPCTSPLELSGVADGDHVLRVVARDPAGNESEEVRVEWTALPERTLLGDGAWSWFADPRAVHHGGRTYVGWVARDGDIKVSVYDHATLSRTTALVAPRVEVDDHANPAVQILPDGRVRVYYSAHGGPRMWYRTSLAPEDVSAWGPAVTVPENSAGNRGFTYPNPVHLAAEGRTYLFWRGGDYQPTFTSQDDGTDAWRPVRRLVSSPGQRPYVKFDSDGDATIHIAFTNAHPAESNDVNIYYAAYRGGALRRADGTVIGALGTAIEPRAADVIYDAAHDAWIHDVAHDADGRPVLVFAAFPAAGDHRYVYARWTGDRWVTRPITAAGGSISEDPREPYYSGGITLDHEDPSVVYLSRQVGGAWEVETWRTANGGATWSTEAVTAQSGTKNVRPVSPRGLLPFSGDMSVLWMRGRYPYYLTYETSIATILRTGGNEPPVADAAAIPRSGRAPLAVAFDGRPSSDPDGAIAGYRWDFGDGASAGGAQATHVYDRAGRYFPRLTVTDDGGRQDTYVAEIEVRAGAVTGPALELTGASATLTGAVPAGSTYHFAYGAGARTADAPVPAGGGDVQTVVDGLTPGTAYRYRLVVQTPDGETSGDEREFTAGVAPGYRDAVLGTPGLLGYWRLGDAGPASAADALGRRPGTYSPTGVTLGVPGAVRDDPDTAAGFDGLAGELAVTSEPLTTSGTLEGWFRWEAGVALLRDSTSMSGVGWILAYDAGGMIACRAGGTPLVSAKPVASVRTGWHHFALTRDGDDVRLYLDGVRLALTGGAPGTATAAAPWHVMRNGTTTNQYTRGQADEIALYDRALTAADIRQRVALGP